MKRREFITASALSLGAFATPNTLLAGENSASKKHRFKKLICVEEHFILPEISAQVMQFLAKKNGGKPPISEAQRDLMKIVLPTQDFIAEVGEKRLDFMNKAGISTQILSYGAGSPQNLMDISLADELCQKANNELLNLISKNPSRFGGFALLPMVSVEKAVQELERTARLGLKGAMISGTINGKFLDEPEFFPLFEKAEKLGVPLFLHPAIIDEKIVNHYYQSAENQWSKVAGLMFSSAGFGWHLDSGIQVLRLIFAGIFDRLPNLQIISGHWGEMVPFYLNRLDDQQSKTLHLRHRISDYYKKNIYISPSGFFSENQLKFAISEVGAERILYACDYPFLWDEKSFQFLENANITKKEKQQIAYENAEKLFSLK